MVVNSKIKVTIDIVDANGKIQTFKQNLTQVGTAGQKAGMQVQQGMQQATSGINTASQSAVKASVNFQTMGMGMLNLSTAGVQTFTSFSNLDRVQNRAAASAVGLQRAQDLLARKSEQLTKLQEAGNGAGRDAVLITKEIATARADLAVKTDKLKIEEAAVTDVYMLFAANLMNVGVSSLMIYKTAFEGVTIATVRGKIATVANTVATRLGSIERWAASRSLAASTLGHTTLMTAQGVQTVATVQATVATRALNLALGPVGLLIMGISAALVAYETNFMGFKDGINGFLGIQNDFNAGVEDGTGAINEQTAALNSQKKAFDDLSTPMQNYIRMNEIAAIQSRDPSRIRQVAEQFRGSGSGSGSGFSPGVGSPNFGSGGGNGSGISAGSGGSSGAFMSSNTVGGTDPYVSSIGDGKSIPGITASEFMDSKRLASTNIMYGTDGKVAEPTPDSFWNALGQAISGDVIISTSNKKILDEEIQKHKTLPSYDHKPFDGKQYYSSNQQAMYSGFNVRQLTADMEKKNAAKFSYADPIGTPEQQMSFYNLQPKDQEIQLRSFIDMFPDGSGTQLMYIETYETMYNETDGFRKVYKKGGAVDPSAEFNAQLNKDFAGMPKNQSAHDRMNSESIFDFDLSNRELVKKGLGVDIGVIGDRLNTHDAIRLGSMQKSLGKFNAPHSKWVTDVMEFETNIPYIVAGSMNFDVKSLRKNMATGGRTAELLREIRNFGGINRDGQTSATAMYQIQDVEEKRIVGYDQKSGKAVFETRMVSGLNWARKAEWKAELAFNDMMANTGLGNRIKAAGNVFGVTQQLGVGYRSNLPSPVHWAKYDTTTAMARTFGSDEIAKQEMIDAKIRFDINMASGRPGGIIPFINAYYEETQQIAARSNTRAASKTQSIGIDFDPNANEGWWERRVAPGSKGVVRLYWNKTSLSSEGQIRADIQASASVSLPSVTRLIAISESFANNGKYTNFNNTAITQDAMAKLGMTEQTVFDIRFESTRGDRELENRMRHIEQQAASSSGTSPL